MKRFIVSLVLVMMVSGIVIAAPELQTSRDDFTGREMTYTRIEHDNEGMEFTHWVAVNVEGNSFQFHIWIFSPSVHFTQKVEFFVAGKVYTVAPQFVSTGETGRNNYQSYQVFVNLSPEFVQDVLNDSILRYRIFGTNLVTGEFSQDELWSIRRTFNAYRD